MCVFVQHCVFQVFLIALSLSEKMQIYEIIAKSHYLISMKGTEFPNMYWGILPSHFCTAS